jgi:hypothetical protein
VIYHCSSAVAFAVSLPTPGVSLAATKDKGAAAPTCVAARHNDHLAKRILRVGLEALKSINTNLSRQVGDITDGELGLGWEALTDGGEQDTHLAVESREDSGGCGRKEGSVFPP